MKQLLLGIIISAFLCTTAFAYTVSFDGNGTDAGGEHEINEMLFSGLYEGNTDIDISPGEAVAIFTYQDFSTGLFTESFSIRLDDIREPGEVGVTDVSGYDIYADITLTGQYVDDNNIFFTGGSAIMYVDDVAPDYDYTSNGDLVYNEAGEDPVVATFGFDYALASTLAGSLFGDQALQMQIDVAFVADYLNPDYWGAEEVDLADLGFLLSVIGTDISQQFISEEAIYDGDIGDAGGNDYIIGWNDDQGFIAKFEVVPEPTTMLLFGIGLLGLAGVSRRQKD